MDEIELEMGDRHRLRAALGWSELGNPAEALEELNRVTASLHPDVLEVRWMISAAVEDWEAALRSAELLVEKHPRRSSGWVHRAYALRRVANGGLEKAWEALLAAYEAFPRERIISYNLACYAAQFGRLDEAWDWLQKAIEVGEDLAGIKKLALSDDDLKPLWDRIRRFKA